jgi:uncharacterized protein (DUF1015 family)
MSSIKPFKSYCYNPEKIKDFGKVLCPPYDVISEEERVDLANQSPYNFVHLILPKDKSDDDKTVNKYTRSKKLFEEWVSKGVLGQDVKPGIYFYKQEYKVLGQKFNRLGFISLMELEDEKDSKIHPHENTHAIAVEDRFKLWSTLDANLSCIFVCYSDIHRKVEKIFNKEVVAKTPILDVEDKDNVRHKLWQISDPDLIKEINDSVSNQPLFIADGHHRFRVANEIRRQKLAKKTNITGNEPFNYVMTYFTNIDSRDLQILPMHRIVKHLPKSLDFFEEYFRIDKVPNKDDLLILLSQAGRNEHAFGFYTSEGFRLLRLKNKMLIDEFVKEGSHDYRHLDATILKVFVFDRIGVKSEDIIYTKSLDETISKVKNKEAEASFIMNPVKVSQLKAIALNGEKMPPKTTYFYPKVLSGLTVYKFD